MLAEGGAEGLGLSGPMGSLATPYPSWRLRGWGGPASRGGDTQGGRGRLGTFSLLQTQVPLAPRPAGLLKVLRGTLMLTCPVTLSTLLKNAPQDGHRG